MKFNEKNWYKIIDSVKKDLDKLYDKMVIKFKNCHNKYEIKIEKENIDFNKENVMEFIYLGRKELNKIINFGLINIDNIFDKYENKVEELED